MELKMFNAIVDSMEPEKGTYARGQAENLLARVGHAVSVAGLTICDLKPLAELLGCVAEMGAIKDATHSLLGSRVSDNRRLYAAIREQEQNCTRLPISRAYICSTGVLPVPAGTKIDVLLADDTELLGIDNPEDRIWDDVDHPRCIKAYRPHVPTRRSTATHTLLHAGELYREVTTLLHTDQLVAWRTADGQEYSAKAHQVTLDPDEDGLAAAILSRIAGVEIAPEHMAELRAQMAGGVAHG